MKVGVCIGHSRSGDAGAVSVGDVSEWNYNVPVGEKVTALLQAAGVEVLFLTAYEGGSYGSAMSWVARELDAFGADCAIELHFNSASASARGFEHLYWHSSSKGKDLALAIFDGQAQAFPDSVARDVKPKTSNDRGSGFLSKPACPTVIVEPFFGSNQDDWEQYRSEAAQDKLAGVYADAILSFLGVSAPEVPETPTEPETPEIDHEGALARIEAAEIQLADAKRILRGGG